MAADVAVGKMLTLLLDAGVGAGAGAGVGALVVRGALVAACAVCTRRRRVREGGAVVAAGVCAGAGAGTGPRVGASAVCARVGG